MTAVKVAKVRTRNDKPPKAISLFASGGIGDLALCKNNIEVIVANELLEDRASLFRRNFPETLMLSGDIWSLRKTLVKETKNRLNGEELDFMLATPPCQGMSKNGQGKLLNEIRAGKRPRVDPRNRLIIPTLDIAAALQPRTVVFENVPEMALTVIDDEEGEYVNIVDYISSRLGNAYEGRAQIVAFADYGVPQRRQRLITVFTRDENLKKKLHENGTLLTKPTHSKLGAFGKKKWVSVRDVIGDLPELDAKDKASASSRIPFHSVPVLDEKKYKWVSNTPPERGAFDNQCINQDCLYDKNPTHSSRRNSHGINRASNDTPIYCIKCGKLLPRPYTNTKDGIRLMKGYTSAYKRMRWDLPASTLTTNLQYPSSDHKLHPDQNRVLSLYEAFKIHTLDAYDFIWELQNSKKAPNGLIRDVIGESIPPKGLEILFRTLVEPKRAVAIKQPQLIRQMELVSNRLGFAGLEN
jgi:DNA (cytosine-5)-methyltransferase 1